MKRRIRRNAYVRCGVGEKSNFLPITIVYGIAITAMSYFTDQTISTLTSGTLSQNVDLKSLSFPRRIGVRLNVEYSKKLNLIGKQSIWTAYEDKNFTKQYEGKDFTHETIITREGWSRYLFKGVFPKNVAYLKCEIKEHQTGQLIKTFYFRYEKGYEMSLDGRRYKKDPILQEKIVKDGILEEMVKTKNGFKKGTFTVKQEKVIIDEYDNPSKELIDVPVIEQNSVKYCEKTKFVSLITPPHLKKYAKVLLILITQMVQSSFEQSYMGKDNQKPLYKTYYILDELGNLQSEGHGIESFETYLSIGLGQDQLFLLILQTLQQRKYAFERMINCAYRVIGVYYYIS